MKLTTLAITIVSAAASITVGVASYQAVAPPDPAAADSPATAAGSYPVTRKAPPLDPITVFADCPKDTLLRGKVCIRQEERTVVEYVAAPAPPPQQVAAPTYPSNNNDPGPRDEGNDDNHDSGPRNDDGPANPPADDDGDHDRDEDGEDHEDHEDGEDHEDHEDHEDE